MSHGKWESLAARLYYLLGSFYYLYHWLGIAGAFGLAASLVSLYRPFFGVAFLFIVSLGLLAAAGYFWLRGARRRLQGVNPALQLLTVEQTYSILPGRQYTHTRAISAVARRDGVDSYHHKFSWSGEGLIVASVVSPPRAHAEVARHTRGPGHVCTVRFERPLRKGEPISFCYVLKMTDSAGTTLPFLSMNILDWVQEWLFMKVRFADGGRRPESVKRQILLSHVADLPIFEDKIHVSPDGDGAEVHWRIKRPRPTCTYRIDW